MRCWLRETTSLLVAVQEPPRLSVMLIGVSARVLRERGDIGSVKHGAPAVVKLAGSPAGEGLSLRRLEGGREFPVERCRDDVASPGADVDVPFIAKSREAVAELGFDADLEDVCTAHDMRR